MSIVSRVHTQLTDEGGEARRATVGVLLEAVRDDGSLLGRVPALSIGEARSDLELLATLHATHECAHH